MSEIIVEKKSCIEAITHVKMYCEDQNLILEKTKVKYHIKLDNNGYVEIMAEHPVVKIDTVPLPSGYGYTDWEFSPKHESLKDSPNFYKKKS